MSRYHDAMTAVVDRYGGYVANYLGDGVLAYFGWPRADEDEAAQAVRAGLAAVARQRNCRCTCMSGSPPAPSSSATSTAAGRRQAGAIAGETPNLAARLEALAGPDQVMIGGLTRQLIGGAFILDDLGPQQLKGIAEPVRAWQVLAERAVESRFDARAGRLTPFIGREHEVALLLDRFERAAAGEGQAVLLSGDAGIGKSRLVQRLQRASSPACMRMRMQCSPFHTATALHPVFRHLEHAAGFSAGVTIRTRSSRSLKRCFGKEWRMWPSVWRCSDRCCRCRQATATGRSSWSPEQRKDRVLRLLVDFNCSDWRAQPGSVASSRMRTGSTRHPRIRRSSSAASRRCAHSGADHLSARVPIRLDTPPASNGIDAEPSEPRTGRRGGSRGRRRRPADDVVARIGRRAEGVPLFIEELTRSVLDSGEAPDSEIPETLQASLLARLDRLGPDVKELAQIAAVIGTRVRCGSC